MISAIILAAGNSSRMGQTKALLEIGQTNFIGHILHNIEAAGITDIYVVLGRDENKIRSSAGIKNQVRVLINPDPDRGQLSSLHICLPHLSQLTHGVLMVLVDHPLVALQTYKMILERAASEPDKIIIPVYHGKKGHPVYFGRKFFDELMAAPLNAGARVVVHANPDDVVLISVEDSGILKDIDLPEDYSYYVSENRKE